MRFHALHCEMPGKFTGVFFRVHVTDYHRAWGRTNGALICRFETEPDLLKYRSSTQRVLVILKKVSFLRRPPCRKVGVSLVCHFLENRTGRILSSTSSCVPCVSSHLSLDPPDRRTPSFVRSLFPLLPLLPFLRLVSGLLLKCRLLRLELVQVLFEAAQQLCVPCRRLLLL